MRPFLAGLGTIGSGAEMVRTILALAETHGIEVVAEGAETAAQLEALRDLRCRYVQGFYYSKAVDAAGAERLIRRQPWRAATRQAS